jgi:nicotinamide-nucleotide amidase
MYPQKIIDAIKDILIPRNQSIAVAESVTSGHLQAALSLADDARQFYQGGMTAYNLGQKVKHLGVEPIHALDCNCVSAIVAQQMAVGVAALFTATYGVSITGYAAKVPERDILVPFAFYTLCRNDEILLTKRIESANGDAMTVQLYYTDVVLKSLLELLVEEKHN